MSISISQNAGTSIADVASDGCSHSMPITTATTYTSGTGAGYANASPDYGYITAPDANVNGWASKYFSMFAGSNSTYGFNFTKEMRVACKVSFAWINTFTGINYYLSLRQGYGATNGTLQQVGFGIGINMATKVLSIIAHNGTTLTTKVTSWVPPQQGSISSVNFIVKSDGNGTVSAYADDVFIDSTTGMSTANNSNVAGVGAVTTMLAVSLIDSTSGTSTANATGYISNLKAYIAQG